MIDDYRRAIAELLYLVVGVVLPVAVWGVGIVMTSHQPRMLYAFLIVYTAFVIIEGYTIDTYRPWLRRKCRRLLGVEPAEPPDPHDIEAEPGVCEQ